MSAFTEVPESTGIRISFLDRALDGVRDAGAEIEMIVARDLSPSGGCLECGGCEKTGKCVVRDDMDKVYPLFEKADAVILSAPVFFYGVPAQVKAVIDRSQAMWSQRLLRKTTSEDRKVFDSGKGYLIAVGATRGKQLFDGVILTAKYFYDALDMEYGGELLFRGLDGRKDVDEHPEMLSEAYELGKRVVLEGTGGPA